MCQSLIRSHANGPDPEDVALVRMVMMNAGQTHGCNVIGRRTASQCADGMEGATEILFESSTAAAICVLGPM
jgi:hypothetical protein